MPNRDPKNNYPRPGQQLQIGPLEADELKSPNKNIGIGGKPYANIKDGGLVSFESAGPKVGKGKVPNDVLARYRKLLNFQAENGLPRSYLDHGGRIYYYQSRGKSLVDLETKLGAVAAKTLREEAKTPKLNEYVEVFGDETGTRLFNEEQEAMGRLTPGKKNTKTPKDYSRGHIRADGEGGRWHTRNLRLENTVRNAQQRQQVLSPEVENALLVGGSTNQEFIATQGPRTTPLQTQNILSGKTKLPGKNLSIRGGSNAGFMNAGLLDKAGGAIKNNWKSELFGTAIGLATDPAQRQNIIDGNVRGLVKNGTRDAIIGGVTNNLVKLGISKLPAAIAPIAGGVASLAPPVIAGLAIGQALDAAKNYQLKQERKREARQMYGRNNGPQQITQGKTGKAILNGKEITVPYGSVAGEGKNFAQKAWDSFNSLF